jgi:hypothetical protein
MPVSITLTIPDAHVARALDAFAELSDKNIALTLLEDGLQGNTWTYNYAPKQASENSQQFAVRVAKETLLALIRLQDSTEDRERYKTEVAGIDPVAQDIPDNMIG